MEILLPKKSNGSPGEKLSSRTVTVIGANGAGKSSFGVEIARQIKEHAFWLSAQKALCLMPPHEVWPGSIEAQYKEAIDRSHYVSKETPTEFDQLLFLLLSEEFRNLFSYKFEVQKGGHVDLPKTRLDRVQRLWERIFPKNKMLRAEGKLLIQSEDSEPFNPLRLTTIVRSSVRMVTSISGLTGAGFFSGRQAKKRAAFPTIMRNATPFLMYVDNPFIGFRLSGRISA